MSVVKLTRTVSIVNPEGLHCRFATLIAGLVRRFDAQVVLCKDAERAQGTEALQILCLAAAQGDQLLLEATGSEAVEALDALEQLIRNYSQEDQSSPAPEPS